MGKDKYKVTNWPAYNEGLKQRGSLTLWIDGGIASDWIQGCENRRGGQRVYSAMAIETCLVLRKVYRLPLRQAEGFIKSIFGQLKIQVPVPCYTTLCRRSNGLSVNLATAKGGITDIVVDSTGLKVYGEGEWKVRKHGAGKHRTWMKLHVAVNAQTQQIQAASLTSNAVDDAAEVGALLGQVCGKAGSFYGDGAYDKEKVRELLHRKNIRQVVPPQRNAVADGGKRPYMEQRDGAIRTIKEMGRAEWKIKEGYHQRSKAETAMFRYKSIIGPDLSARKLGHQQTEVLVGCRALNIMLQTAKPVAKKIA